MQHEVKVLLEEDVYEKARWWNNARLRRSCDRLGLRVKASLKKGKTITFLPEPLSPLCFLPDHPLCNPCTTPALPSLYSLLNLCLCFA